MNSTNYNEDEAVLNAKSKKSGTVSVMNAAIPPPSS